MPVYLSFKLKSLLEGFLKKSPKERLGANSASEVKNHPWFDKIDFDQLLEYEIEAPFVPHLKSDVDVSNFDTEFTQCEIDSYGDNTDLEEASRFKDFSFDEDTMLKRCESIDTEASSEFEMKF